MMAKKSIKDRKTFISVEKSENKFYLFLTFKKTFFGNKNIISDGDNKRFIKTKKLG
jgi:hypothetical protein